MDKSADLFRGQAKGSSYCDTPGTSCWYNSHDVCVNCNRRKGWRSNDRLNYSRVVSHNQPIEAGPAINWHEVAMSDCPLGCKIYLNDVTGERVLAHNSSYGCLR